MQAAGNMRRASQELGANSRGQPPARKGFTSRAAEADRVKELPTGGRSMGADKRAAGNKQKESGGPGKRGEKEGQRTENGGGGVKAGAKRVTSESNGFRGSSATRANGKAKHFQFTK